MLMAEHLTLPGSQEHTGVVRTCDRCGNSRPSSDGVASGSRYVCGSCWRRFGFRDPAKKFGVKK